MNHLALFGNIQLSTQAIQQLCEMEIPVTYFSMGGWFYGLTHGHGLNNVFTRVEQFRRAADPLASLELAKQFIHGKIRNQRTLLMRNHHRTARRAAPAAQAGGEGCVCRTVSGGIAGDGRGGGGSVL